MEDATSLERFRAIFRTNERNEAALFYRKTNSLQNRSYIYNKHEEYAFRMYHRNKTFEIIGNAE